MTHVSISGITLALALSFVSLAHAQAAPEGYLALEKYGVEVKEAAPPLKAKTQVFSVERGASLRTTLDQWAQKAGWQPVSWKLPEDTDFTLGAAGQFSGDFIAATRSFINALGTEAELRVRFNQGNLLMVVEPLQ